MRLSDKPDFYKLGASCALDALRLNKTAFAIPAGPMLGGALFGGLSGYALAPEDRKGLGTLYGAGLGGLGAGVGNKLAPMLHSETSAANAGAKQLMPSLSAALGAIGGTGLSTVLYNKDRPDTSENPYHYQ